MSFTTAALTVSWVAILLLALGFAGLLRQVTLLQRVAGPAGGPGGAVPTAGLTGLALPRSGELAALRPPGGGVVVFVSPGCSSCAATVQTLHEEGSEVSSVVVSSGPCPPSGPGAAQPCVAQALPLMERLSVPGTPYLMAVDADGVIGATLLPQDPGQVSAFLARTHRPGGS